MSDAAATAGVGPGIEFRGEVYQLSPLTVEMLAALNVFGANYAWRTVEQTKSFCTPEEYADRYEATTRLVNAGAYAWNTLRGQEINCTVDGKAYELFLRMRACRPEVTLDLAKRIVEEQITEVLNKIVAADHDPDPGKGPKPSGEARGPASTPLTEGRVAPSVAPVQTQSTSSPT